IRQKYVDNDPSCSPELFSLACGPEPYATSYTACLVNGVRFSTPGPNGEMYYGQLEEILELTYFCNRKVVLFRCKWFDTSNVGRSARSHRYVVKNNIKHILTDRDCYRDQQYILATQARQVFYLEDPARRPLHWKVVEEVY
ncbi:Myc-type, basic helix-loop-helix domain-containing protein, partial [Tanacetum coccineum]